MSTDAFAAIEFPAVNSRSASTERGFAAGYAEGLRRAASELDARTRALDAAHAARHAALETRMQQQLAALEAATAAISRATVPALEEVVDALADGAGRLTEAILGHRLSEPEAAARAALDRVLPDRDFSVRLEIALHPADLALIDRSALEALGHSVQPDPALERGDAVARFPGGFLDARVRTALDAALAALREQPAPAAALDEEEVAA